MNRGDLEHVILNLDSMLRGHCSPAIWQSLIERTAERIRAERAGKVVPITGDAA